MQCGVASLRAGRNGRPRGYFEPLCSQVLPDSKSRHSWACRSGRRGDRPAGRQQRKHIDDAGVGGPHIGRRCSRTCDRTVTDRLDRRREGAPSTSRLPLRLPCETVLRGNLHSSHPRGTMLQPVETRPRGRASRRENRPPRTLSLPSSALLRTMRTRFARTRVPPGQQADATARRAGPKPP
jgi:hypothetical protein